MPKKMRRTHRKPVRTPAREPIAPVTVSSPATTARSSAKVDLSKEYAYVFADLRKIAIIGGVMFVLLFALALALG